MFTERWQLRRTYFLNHYNVCFNEFAFTVQVKHKINSTRILGLILICLYFTTGHFHTCVLCKECSRYLPFLILDSVFSDCVVFYGDDYQPQDGG